jgi:protein-tyrosine phosphatase
VSTTNRSPVRGARLKRMYRTARNLPDRMLHGRRLSNARAQVVRLQHIRSIIIVCYGNVCRSPYLEALLQRELPQIRVTSAGFVSPGRPVPPHSLTLSRARGLDLTAHSSRPIARANVAGTDLVIVMDSEQARRIAREYRISPDRIVVAGDLDPIICETRAIRDPWGQPVEVFASSFDRLDRCATTLIHLLRYRC